MPKGYTLRLSDGSNIGPLDLEAVKSWCSRGLVKPDVCAFPGPKIALVASGDSGYLPDNNRKRGNSLSAPHVAGACAMVLEAAPELPAWRVKEILEKTARDLLPRGKDVETGAGLLDVHAAVKAAQKAANKASK